MDAPSAVAMAEPAADAPGFVFDASSGLYYDASSGFYYDAKAGWYYNTQNGQYYIYENDAYVPLVATTKDESAPPAPGDELNQALIPSAGHLSDEEDDVRREATSEPRILSPSGDPAVLTQTAGLGSDRGDAIRESTTSIIKDSAMKDVSPAVLNSEWQDPSCRHVQNSAENSSDASSGLIPGTEMSLLSMGNIPVESLDKTFEGTERGESNAEPEETRPASVWIAETLSELYSQNTFEGPVDGGESEAYVDPSSQHVYYQSNSSLENTYDYTYMNGDHNGETWQETQYHYRKQWGDSLAWDDHATIDNELYESDDQSEELEEGEWRPEEEEKENYVFADIDEVEEGEIREDPNEEPGISGVDGNGHGTYSGEDRAHAGSLPTDDENYQHDTGEVAGTSYCHTTEASVDMVGNGMDYSASDLAAEEQWQAQYLRTAKPKARSYIGSMDLWDWSIIEQEKKIGKKKVKKIFRLIGRLAPNATQVHPSLRGSGGLIRTTPICEADHEFVKVSSGRIYKLRRPSSKHLTVYSGYVSSNPTQDWGLPLINTDTEEDHIDSSLDPIDATISSSTGSGHWNGQLASKKKNARLKPKGVDGGPELKYRDRAAERRTLHKGFGIGPGQKAVSVHELEKEEAEAATEMPAALKKAASARPIGRENIGKRMLEGMGWKEGQSLGSGEGGLVDPILALGNTGRTGLGWL
ncbi:hypothetical protein M758_4G020100 [Ceratodon purpureus]|nr:hypothetical protein M758_4G020100 [Ceratodon purpureus]